MLDRKLLSSLFTLIAGVAAAVTVTALQPVPRAPAGAGPTAAGSSGPSASTSPDDAHACAALAPSTHRSGCAAGAAETPPCNTLPQSDASPCGLAERPTRFTPTLAIRSKS